MPFKQFNPPQHPALLFAAVQAPPAFRQQFKAPSPGKPLSAQTTAPPLWLHCAAAVHAAPSANPPLPLVGGVPPGVVPVPDPPQTPPLHPNPPQHCPPLEQVPPWLRQQFSAPSFATPFSAQTAAPPAWLHCDAAVHDPPSGICPVEVERSVQTPLRQ